MTLAPPAATIDDRLADRPKRSVQPRRGRGARRSAAPLLWGLAALAAVGAAATAMETRRIEKKHPRLGRTVRVQGVDVHFLEAGTGDPVLLLHGNAVSAGDWAQAGLFQRLAQSHRVLAPDRPGFGYTARPRDRQWTPKMSAALFADFLRATNAAPAVIVAHSVVLQTALRLALDHPDVVRALVLISGYYFPTARPDALAAGALAAPVTGDLWRATTATFGARLSAPATTHLMFAPQRPPPNFTKESFELAFRPLQLRAFGADGVYMAPEARTLCHRLGTLAVPVVYVTGDRDRIVDCAQHSKRAAQETPEGELVVIRGAGHMAHYADPEQIAGAVERLTQTGGAAAREETMLHRPPEDRASDADPTLDRAI